jgi:hypothetical protein
MAEFDSKLVKCPYYRNNDSNRICCEGLKDKTTINFTFEDSKKRRSYMDIYCNDIHNYNKCMICNMLNRKYGVIK